MFSNDNLRCSNVRVCVEPIASLSHDGDCPMGSDEPWEHLVYDEDYENYVDVGEELQFNCMEEKSGEDIFQNPDIPVVVVIGATGVGKSTFCNFLSGKSNDDEIDSYKAGTNRNEDAVTKHVVAKRVKWLGIGEEFILIDTPGLTDPGGPAKDREQFREVIAVLKQINKISLLIHIVKGSDTRKLPYLKTNLLLLKFMFGDALKTNFINEVTFWSHYDHTKRQQHEFRDRRNVKHQELFNNDTSLTVETVFVDPIDALPQDVKEKKEKNYKDNPSAMQTQNREVEELRYFIWDKFDKMPFSCKDTCDFAQGYRGTEVK